MSPNSMEYYQLTTSGGVNEEQNTPDPGFSHCFVENDQTGQ